MLIFRFSQISRKFEISGTSAGQKISRGYFRPPVDISFRNRVFTIRIDIPGVNPDEITIEAGENEIVIQGAVSTEKSHGPCRLLERSSGIFLRKLKFPSRISPDKVEASMSNGVLTLHIPAPELGRDPTTIEIRIVGAD